VLVVRNLIVLSAVVFCSCNYAEAPLPFVSRPPDFHPYLVYDMGIADFNDDGNLDIFTSNCFASPNFLAGDGRGGFVQVRSKLGLDYTPEFPGFGTWHTPPEMEKPGVYIYAHGPYFCVKTHQAAALAPVCGSVRTICRENITEVRGVKLDVVRRFEPSGLVSRTIHFAFEEEGLLRFRPEPHLLGPTTIELDPAIPLQSVFVGLEKTNPKTNRFDIYFQDYHSMAWADISGDGRSDVFIGRGAMISTPELKPRIDELKDWLLIASGSGFADITDAAGMKKNGCPNRKSCWVDANGDNLLDLFYVGARGAKSCLYVRKEAANLEFEDRAALFGVDNLPSGGFCWRDFDLDGAIDLAASAGGCAAVFWGGTKEDPKMLPKPILNAEKAPFKVISCEYNRDGQTDLLYIFLQPRPRLALLENKGGRLFEEVSLSALGLPDEGMYASWCDYDNDGLEDYLIVPGGLFRQTSPGHFEATGLLSDLFDKVTVPPVYRVWIFWFDMDNNGTRDLLYKRRVLEDATEPPARHADIVPTEAVLLENTLKKNHWLQVELTGPAGNGPGLGARVSVEAGGAVQTHEVGDSEGSESSQGHYRLYFGLGGSARADSVEVRWQDGTISKLSDVEADRLLRIPYRAASGSL